MSDFLFLTSLCIICSRLIHLIRTESNFMQQVLIGILLYPYFWMHNSVICRENGGFYEHQGSNCALNACKNNYHVSAMHRDGCLSNLASDISSKKVYFLLCLYVIIHSMIRWKKRFPKYHVQLEWSSNQFTDFKLFQNISWVLKWPCLTFLILVEIKFYFSWPIHFCSRYNTKMLKILIRKYN